MAIIGTFSKTNDGYKGYVETITVSAATQFQPVEKKSPKAPDYRIFSHGAEIGAAWIKSGKAETTYLSVMLDDPSFNAPIPCRLIANDSGKFNLVWSR